MRPDRQRRGARHGRGRKAGQAPERIPAPIQRAAARFLYLARPGAGFSPFPGFPRRVEKGHPSHRQKSASKPPKVRGVPCPCPALRCRERSALVLLSAEIQLNWIPMHRTPRRCFFYFQSAGKRPPIGGALGFPGRSSAAAFPIGGAPGFPGR